MSGPYLDHVLRRLEILWGRGFMSPGGPEEVKAIVGDLDWRGLRGLDIGCGLGGPSIVIVAALGAASLVGIDIDDGLLKGASARAREAGIEDQLTFKHVEPGALPFAEASFDFVFSKDSILHVEDKDLLFREVLRVLKPGTWLAASDWLTHPDCESIPEWAEYQAKAPFTTPPTTAEHYAAALKRARFAEIAMEDRNAWFSTLATEQLALIEGPLRADLIAASSRESYDAWVVMRRAQTAAVVSGALRPTHFQARRPLRAA